MTIKAPYLPYDKLREVAEAFFDQHHPSRAIPVPIAAIVEFGFQMDIAPIPGLHDSLEIDSSLSNDLATIYVDEFVFKKRLARYHFSLAHELSHKLIHPTLFRDQLSFATLAEWKVVMNSIPPREYGFIEWQAYCLAGLILVPSSRLGTAYAKAEESAAAAGISLRDLDAESARVICSAVGEDFQVSADVVRKRLHYDDICHW
ncbi:MAG: ImmA/IrrE family metallo-endopeptidase [Planctomycetia bacterium]|nr:ImmA/IrrE family metallo-endopeptidase [Planctomycetia bacterium]